MGAKIDPFPTNERMNPRSVLRIGMRFGDSRNWRIWCHECIRVVRSLGSLAWLRRRRKLAEAIYSVEGAQRMRLKTNLCCRTESDKKRKKSVSFSFFTALLLPLSPLSVKTFRVALDRKSSSSYENEVCRHISASQLKVEAMTAHRKEEPKFWYSSSILVALSRIDRALVPSLPSLDANRLVGAINASFHLRDHHSRGFSKGRAISRRRAVYSLCLG